MTCSASIICALKKFQVYSLILMQKVVFLIDQLNKKSTKTEEARQNRWDVQRTPGGSVFKGYEKH